MCVCSSAPWPRCSCGAEPGISAAALPLLAVCEREGSVGLSVRPSLPAPVATWGGFQAMAAEQVCFPPSLY